MSKGVDSQFDKNEITGASWTSDQSGTEDQIHSMTPAEDQMNEPYSHDYSDKVPAPGQAIEIGADGGAK